MPCLMKAEGSTGQPCGAVVTFGGTSKHWIREDMLRRSQDSHARSSGTPLVFAAASSFFECFVTQPGLELAALPTPRRWD